MRAFFISFLAFLYLYPFALKVFPVGTRSFLAAGGVGLFFLYMLNAYKTRWVINKFLLLLTIMLPFVAFSILTGLLNATYDFQFARLAFSFILMFFAAYFILEVAKQTKLHVTEKLLLEIVVYAVAIQSIVSFFMFFSPSFQSLVFAHLNFSDLALSKMQALSERGIIGFSRSFFGAGIYSGLALMLLSYLLAHYAKNIKQLAWYVLLFFLIFSIGMMMARTTLVGAALGLAYLFFPRKKILQLKVKRSTVKTIALFIVLPLFSLFLLVLLAPNFMSKINNLLQFGFELFINIFEGKGAQTSSTDVLMTMLVWPDSFKTWMIGDGLWDLEGGMKYYMSTDVGYSRMLFYFGILGMLSFLYYHFYLVKKSFGFGLFAAFLIAYILILNVKGFAQISVVLLLLFLSSSISTRYR